MCLAETCGAESKAGKAISLTGFGPDNPVRRFVFGVFLYPAPLAARPRPS
jgi:hypothetical protein